VPPQAILHYSALHLKSQPYPPPKDCPIPEQSFRTYIIVLGFFLESQEPVALILAYDTIFRKITGSTLSTIRILSKEIDSLRLATT
jgi:hypothetical protein